MTIDKALLTDSTGMLLEEGDRYGYQMIEALRERSQDVFQLKAGTLYPLLHQLEQKEYVEAYDQAAGEARVRQYYHLTQQGRHYLAERQGEWRAFSGAVERALGGGQHTGG